MDPDRAWKAWHLAFHVVPDLPETLITGRERDYVGWFLAAMAAVMNILHQVFVESALPS